MQWRSVEEQQPEESGKYLVCCAFLMQGQLGRRHISTEYYYAEGRKPHWGHEELDLRVTHWMELPPLPGEDGKAEHSAL